MRDVRSRDGFRIALYRIKLCRGTVKRADDGLGELAGRGGSAEVWSWGGLERRVDGTVERGRELARVRTVTKQQRHRPQHRSGVRDPLAGEIGRRSMDRLEHSRPVVAEAGRGGETEPARGSGCDVGEDVAERVLRQEDVEARWILGEPEAGGVDEHVLELDVRVLRRECAHDLAP